MDTWQWENQARLLKLARQSGCHVYIDFAFGTKTVPIHKSKPQRHKVVTKVGDDEKEKGKESHGSIQLYKRTVHV